MHRLSPLFCMEVKDGRQTKGYKTVDNNRDETVQKNSRVHTSWQQKKWRNCGRAECRTGWQETKKIQIKLSALCNKIEQQQDGKRKAELQSEGTKTTWKTLKRQLNEAETRSNWWRMMVMFYHLRMRKLNKKAVYFFVHGYSLKKSKYNSQNI